MLLCAGILGRYYTDEHDVDEELMSIPIHGGRWFIGSLAGIMDRSMNYAGASSDVVASRCRHPKLIKYYTDWHDVDEEMRTIAEYGGRWESGSKAGIAFRDMTSIPTYTVDTVASRKIYPSQHHFFTFS